ncbi:gamma-glutamylcyclotransferase family protein [Neobacillus sp. Marseille-QA0830]
MHKVFVYGTLRKGGSNDRFLKHAICLAEQCWTNGVMYDSSYGYPAVEQGPSTRVYGELYEVTDSELARLDWLEDYTEGRSDNLYERIQQTINTDQGPIAAYIYIANQPDLLKYKIPYGDWKGYRLLGKHNKKQKGKGCEMDE